MKRKRYMIGYILVVLIYCTSCKAKEKETDSTNIVTPTIEVTESVDGETTTPTKAPDLPLVDNQSPEVTPEVDIVTGGAVTDEIDPTIEGEEDWMAGEETQEVFPDPPQDESESRIFDNNTKAYLDDQGTIAAIRISNNQITVTDIIKTSKEHLVIPSTIDDMKVTTIGNQALSKTIVSTVELEEGINSIASHAFYGNTNLVKISIPKSITEIGTNAFGNCMNLSVINLAEGNKNYCLVNGVLYNIEMTSLIKYPSGRLDETCLVEEGVISIEAGAFSMSHNLAYVFLPNSLRSIGTEAFAGCIMLNIDLPDKLLELDSYAFADCYSMREIVIPSSITIIGEGAFSGCEKAKKLTIKGYVKEIGYAAFANCTSLNEVKISRSVEIFGGMAFAFCTSLKRIEIPEGTKELSDMVFYGCNTLGEISLSSTISYFGSMIFEETDNIVVKAAKGTSAADYALSNGLIYQEI